MAVDWFEHVGYSIGVNNGLERLGGVKMIGEDQN